MKTKRLLTFIMVLKGPFLTSLPFSLRYAFIISIFTLGFPFYVSAQTVNPDDHAHDPADYIHQSEDFWATIDFVKIKRELGNALRISGKELDLFYQYLQPLIEDDKVHFFSNAPYGGMLPSEYETYVSDIKQKYIDQYPEFSKVKAEFALEQLAQKSNDQVLAVNGPCTNIGFENGTLNGWTARTGTACGRATCTLFPNNNPGCRVQVTNSSMTDPFIPFLSTVDPTGGNHSVRLENYQNGSQQSSLSQTFMVTPANNVFTYKYAVVLEDPRDGHSDDQRPFFEVMMFDGNGREITCATYTRIAAPTYLSDYINYPVPNPPSRTTSAGCGYGGSNPRNADNTRNFWYKDWTTVSIPLVAYEGQNVTIVFTASDCSRGAHTGYAYVDAECSSMIPLNPVTICGNQNVNYSATPGFASYQWTGPGIQGPANNRTVTVNRPGEYTVTLTPVSDNATLCPTTQTITIYEDCIPPPYSVTMCEEVKGSGTVTGINLDSYNSMITDYYSPPGTVLSWHSGIPRTTNRITNTTNVTVSSRAYYAIVDHASPYVLSDTVRLDFVITPKPNIVFPAIPVSCEGSSSFQINGVTPAGGTFSGPNVSSSGVFNPSTAGTYTIQYKYINAQGCADSITRPAVVVAPPTVNAGPDQTICASTTSVTLSGSVTNAGSEWVGGSGVFSPNRSSVNATYTPHASERTAGSVTLTLRTVMGTSPCPEITDVMVINIVPRPTINAGPNRRVCTDNPTVILSGQFTNAPGVQWSGGGYSGSSPNGSYTPAGSGTYTLTFATVGVTVCPNVSDQLVITVIPEPTVNAGPDQSVCEIASTVALDGAATNYSSVSWIGGSGTFSPNRTTLNAVYTPTTTEKNSGSVTLTLRSGANSPCTDVTDDVTINFIQVPTLDAGPDLIQCATNLVFQMNPVSTGSAGGTWSGGSGSFLPDPTTPNATYNAAPGETSVTLTYTVAGIGSCPPVTDNLVLTIVPAPTVDAGTPQTLCANAARVSLSGTATNYNSVNWSASSSGGSFSPDANRLSTSYFPTEAEKASGSITFTLQSVANSPCTSVSDNVIITFIPTATVDAGPDQTLCATNAVFQLNATLANSSGGNWSTGNGTLANISNVTDPNATYTAASGERSVTLTYTASGNGPCPSIADDVSLTIVPAPTVNAGSDQAHCASVSIISLSGSATDYSAVSWSSGSGTPGIFSPGTNRLITNYIPTAAEKASGSVTLTLTAAANSPCTAVLDIVIITFEQIPTVNAGPDQVQCPVNPAFIMDGTFSNASGASWTSGGNGTFNPNTTSPNTTYTPSSDDISNGIVVLTYTTSGTVYCPAVSDKMTIRIGRVPSPNAGPDQIVCIGASVTASTQSVIYETYVWTNLQSTVLGSGNSVTLTASSDTTLVVTATDRFGCVNSDTVQVDAVPIPIVSVPDSSMCPGGSIALSGVVTNLTDVQMYNPIYHWEKDGSSVSGNNISLNVNSGGVYTLFVTVNGSCTGSDNSIVAINPLPIINMPEMVKFCSESDGAITLDAGPAYQYLWSPNGETTKTIDVGIPGVYSVTITNQFTCSSSDQTLVREVCPPRLFVGNAFSPGQGFNGEGDGINDLYRVYSVHVGKYHLLIFNRWGEIIFESRDKNYHWNGIYRDEPMPIGVYAWIITYEGDTEEYRGPYKLEGSVTVVR